MHRRYARSSTIAIALLVGLVLSGCSVTITADQAPSEQASAAAGSVAPTPDASQEALIDDEYADFCRLEAEGALDMVSLLGDDASTAIADGIAQSIAQQQMNPAQAEVCTQVWLDTMTANGVVFDETAVSSASPQAS